MRLAEGKMEYDREADSFREGKSRVNFMTK